MTGHCLHYVVRKDRSVTLRDYVDFFQCAGNIAEEIRKKRKNDKRLACTSDGSEDI